MAGDADDKRFNVALDVIGNDPNVDAIMAIVLFQTPGADSRVAASIMHHGATINKPIVVVSPGGNYTQAHVNMMESSGIPVYTSPESAARALDALVKYSRYKLARGR